MSSNRKYNKNKPEKVNSVNISSNNSSGGSRLAKQNTEGGGGGGGGGGGSLSKGAKNLRISTSLPGPLAGYKRKRTQAVQVGDDSEFYKSAGEAIKAIAAASNNNNNSNISRSPARNSSEPPDDLYADDDDEEMAEYDESTPQHNLRHVTSISQQTSPIKTPVVGKNEQKMPASLPPSKVTAATANKNVDNTNNNIGCESEFCVKRNKCLCDPATHQLEITSSDHQTQTSTRSSPTNQPSPLMKAKSTQIKDAALTNRAEAEPLIHTKSVATVEGGKKSSDKSPSSPSSGDDEDEGGGFVQAVKGVFGGHFNQMQKRGDLENVVVKFAGNLVSQVGLEAKKVEIPQQIIVEREQWDSKVDFLLSVVGFAVDLSAVWRFPAVCFSNGGGAFLVPYIIMILFCGLPLMYMEFCLGQFHRNGCITIWKTICPMFKGVGFAICVITSIIAMYYNTIMAWSLYILFSSISTTVPWESCNNRWNTIECVTFEQRAQLTKKMQDIIRNCTLAFNATTPSILMHSTAKPPGSSSSGESFIVHPSESSSGSGGLMSVYGSSSASSTHSPDYSQSEGVTGFDIEAICNATVMSGTTHFVFQNQTSSAEEYFYNGVLELNRSSGFTDLGPIKWQIAACLMLIFVVVYFALWKGVKSSGKAVWFTATFPYAVLFILLCRVMTLPGSWNGVMFYITPNLESLYQLRVWQEAAGQVLFQLGPGFGVLLALSSYNKFHNNCLTDAVITTAISSFTSIMAGFVVFGTLGYIAVMLDKSIDQLEAFGHGLTFVAYPEAISTLPGAPIWAVLFFAMLINLGLDTTFGGLESMITGLLDYLPLRLYKRREYFVFAVILYIYFGALPTCTYGGILLAQFYDSYGVEIPLLLIAFLECIGVCYVYGIPHFSRDIALMHGHEPSAFWKFCWGVISPFVVLFSFIAACFREKDTHYRNIPYPEWAGTLGWALTFFSISCVPVYAIYLFIITKGSVKTRLIALVGKDAWIVTWLRGGTTTASIPAEHQSSINKDVEGGGSGSGSGANKEQQQRTENELIANNSDNCNNKVNNEKNTPSSPKRETKSSGEAEKLATIVDMHYCDIGPPSTGASPYESTKPIV